MAYIRKTRDVWTLYAKYDSWHGWEYVLEEDSLSEIKARKQEYRDNAPYPLKIVKRRVKK